MLDVGRMSHFKDRRLWRRFWVLWLLSLLIPVGYSKKMGVVFVGEFYLGPVGLLFSGHFSDLLWLVAGLILGCAIHSLIVFAVAELLFWISIRRD